jgi:hypothetical protein
MEHKPPRDAHWFAPGNVSLSLELTVTRLSRELRKERYSHSNPGASPGKPG